MSADLAINIVSLSLYIVPFFSLLYIGYVKPLWRFELAGVVFVVGLKVSLYMAAVAIYSGHSIAPSPDFLLWISRVSSLTMGIMANVYIFLVIKRLAK